MSTRYVPVTWTRSKLIYDGVLLVSVCGFLIAFQAMAHRAGLATTPTDEGSLPIRMFGDCAFLLMTAALAIGPLARLDHRFLPLLYNRRHLGIVTFAVVAAHVWTTFDWYYAFSPMDPWLAMLVSDASFRTAGNFPFVPFGMAAALILAVLAATSHDFWLNFLGAGLWKRLHMSIYAAYGFVVAHVSFGALQGAQSRALPIVVGAAVSLLIFLHLAASFKDAAALRGQDRSKTDGRWVRVGLAAEIPDGRAVIVEIAGRESIAVFNDGGRYSALSNRCAHQGGPLGEGRIINGCAVCPWHGYEYRLSDGRAPPPHTERVSTYETRLDDGCLYVAARPEGCDVAVDGGTHG